MSPILDHQDVIIRDSIIENKEKTKNYWEQLMMAATSEINGSIRVWDSPDLPISESPIIRHYKNSFVESINNGYSKNGDCGDFSENDSVDLLKNRSFHMLSMENRIALELQEQKEREDELRRLRKQLSLENGKDLCSSKFMGNGSEELCSIHTNDGSTYSEYGSEEKEHSLDGNNSRVNTPHSEDFIHRRTQSLDSVSSGHSSGSVSTLNDKDRESPRQKKILVKPYEDPQEDVKELPIYKRIENETPIEREIRIAKEREEELRKEKGILFNNNKNIEQFKIQKIANKKDAVENDTRDVQHRIATNRIQQEIEEANEREKELRTEGKILTTSEERVDAKVTRFTQLAEFAILENRHKDSKMKRSLSVSQLTVSNSNSSNDKQQNGFAVNQVNGTTTRINRKYAPNPAQKGIMQRFIAGKGKLSFPPMNQENTFGSAHKTVRRALGRSPNGEFVASTARKGYVPAGEKIQEELKEMEKREEELRLQRAYNSVTTKSFFHRSQPNLLNISDEDEEEEPLSWTSHKEPPKPVARLSHSVSNPNLLDDSLEKMNVRLPNKRFSLLQQWENRIQSAQ